MESGHIAVYGEAMVHIQPIAARIAAEILTLIIEWLHPGNAYWYTPWYRYSWPYTYVCRYWKQVLVSAPRFWRFWTCIYIGDSRPSTSQKHRFKHSRLTLQLQRTGTQPLLLSGKSESSLDPKAVQLVALNHSRWKEANLQLSASNVKQLLLVHFQRALPLDFRFEERRETSRYQSPTSSCKLPS